MPTRKPDEFITTIDHATPAQLSYLWQALHPEGKTPPEHGTMRHALYREGVFWVAYKTNPGAHHRQTQLVRNITPVATGAAIRRMAQANQGVRSCTMGRNLLLEGDQSYTPAELTWPHKVDLYAQFSGQEVSFAYCAKTEEIINRVLRTIPAEFFIHNANLLLWRWIRPADRSIPEPLPALPKRQVEPAPRSLEQIRVIFKDGDYSDLTQAELLSIVEDTTDYFDLVEKELAQRAWQQEEDDRTLIAMGR